MDCNLVDFFLKEVVDYGNKGFCVIVLVSCDNVQGEFFLYKVKFILEYV